MKPHGRSAISEFVRTELWTDGRTEYARIETALQQPDSVIGVTWRQRRAGNRGELRTIGL